MSGIEARVDVALVLPLRLHERLWPTVSAYREAVRR